jgi:hypothetical protein
MTPDDYRVADALAEQAAKLADRLGKLENENRPQPEPFPATLAELLKRRANDGRPK